MRYLDLLSLRDYTQFCSDIIEDTCVSQNSHEMKSAHGQLSVDEELVYVDVTQ